MSAEEALTTENTPLLRAETAASNGTIAREQESDNVARSQEDGRQKESPTRLKYIVPAISIGVRVRTIYFAKHSPAKHRPILL